MVLPFTDEELLEPVNAVIKKIRPAIVSDGGDIKLITIKSGGYVYVQLQGACVGCGSSGKTLKYGIERQLRIDIHPQLTVVNVPIGMEEDLETLDKQLNIV